MDQQLVASKTAPLLLLSAAVYASIGDVPAAEKLLKTAIDLDNTNLRAYAMLGNLYASQHRISNARAEFEHIVAREPRSVAALTMIAILLETEHKSGEAVAAYEKVLAVDSHAAIAANNLAWMLAESGRDLGRALTLAQTAKAQLGENASIDERWGGSTSRLRCIRRPSPRSRRASTAPATIRSPAITLGWRTRRRANWPSRRRNSHDRCRWIRTRTSRRTRAACWRQSAAENDSPRGCRSITQLCTSVTSELSGAMVCTNLAGGPAE